MISAPSLLACSASSPSAKTRIVSFFFALLASCVRNALPLNELILTVAANLERRTSSKAEVVSPGEIAFKVRIASLNGRAVGEGGGGILLDFRFVVFRDDVEAHLLVAAAVAVDAVVDGNTTIDGFANREDSWHDKERVHCITQRDVDACIRDALVNQQRQKDTLMTLVILYLM